MNRDVYDETGGKQINHRKETHKKKFLIVEDDFITVELMRGIIEKKGFKVDFAGDGMEGLKKIKQNEYDVIISDLRLPRMGGTELYLKVRKLNPDLAKKIIFISGIITDFIKSTGNRFLVKPVSYQEIVNVLKEII